MLTSLHGEGIGKNREKIYKRVKGVRNWRFFPIGTDLAATMVSIITLARYVASRMEYSVTLSLKNFQQGVRDVDVMRNFFQGKLTYLHWNKGEEMAPTIGLHGGTLLVRKILSPDSKRVFVGDVVVLKDPANTKSYLVRRLAALEGNEMESSDETDEPFVLEEDQCWVLADNESIKPKEAYDSRTFGPVSMSNIVGRVLYCLRNAVDHGPVNNSETSLWKDSPILEVELDVDEMVKNHKV